MVGRESQTSSSVTLRGVNLELHPNGDYVSDQIRTTGEFYEIAILEEIQRRVRGGTLIDVGAMIGNHTVYLAEFVPHAAIHAFEPFAENLVLLRKNTRFYPTVSVHDVALSDREGDLLMSATTDNLGHAVIDPQGYSSIVSRTLDSYHFADVQLLKIDVEGHEPQVLEGAREMIARWSPLIVIEDWERAYARLLPGYELVADFGWEHQTYMYARS